MLIGSVMPRLKVWHEFKRAGEQSGPIRSWKRKLIWVAGLSGFVWGLFGFLFYNPDLHVANVFLPLVLCGMAGGALISQAGYLPAFVAFIIGGVTPYALRLAMEGDQIHMAMATMVAFYAIGMIFLGRSLNHYLIASVEMSAEKEQMVGALKEKSDQVELLLRESEALKATILDSALDCVVSVDEKGRIVEWNVIAEQTFGYHRNEVLGKRMVDLIVPLALREAHNVGFERFLRTNEQTILGKRVRLSAIRANGEEFPVEIAFNSQFSGANQVFTGYLRDITEEQRAEEQLRQAQKMEAVGQLTGGIAHDFNNLLAVIQGNAELVADTAQGNSPCVSAILRATERGAELTQRLLAFSRLQPLQPRPIDLAQLVDELSDLLKRTLGETIDIETKIDPKLWRPLADPGQVENALLNLAINARDAMPNGGKLTIECANAQLNEGNADEHPEALTGSYIVLMVTDNGTGMSAEVLEHAIEPFFTTKEVGQGSGLGLSMVYGFAKQSGGRATIASREGHGTTVSLYLPRDYEEQEVVANHEMITPPHGHGELVLVIEDDDELRHLASKMLAGLDYRVKAVPDAKCAWRVLEQAGKVDLVLSDVVLPGGASGTEFAEEARRQYPGLKIMFMSGYPADAGGCNGLLGSENVLLNKPFQRLHLASAVHKMLD